MSIQINTPISYLDRAKSYIGIGRQVFNRIGVSSSPRVFFRYKTYHTHLAFNSYYDTPPLPWSNWTSAEIGHWINYPISTRLPFVIEVNDHPLSAGAYNKRVEEPWQILEQIGTAHSVYSHTNCRMILMPCEGFRDQFSYYFPGEFQEKMTILPTATCQLKQVDWKLRESTPLTFACLASDYTRKGVDLVLKAWLSRHKPKGVKLIIACPNIPKQILISIKGDKSIVAITKAPLSAIEKHEILNISHVSIAPTHVHGGYNVIEGIEYGHAPILFRYHLRAFDSLGWHVSVPYHFYTPELYGKEWRTFEEFFSRLAADKAVGLFDNTIEELSQIISTLLSDPAVAFTSGKESYMIGLTQFSAQNRNKKLIDLYKYALGKV
jgi:glycosyltransferase involved in cell wall biosynthesis